MEQPQVLRYSIPDLAVRIMDSGRYVHYMLLLFVIVASIDLVFGPASVQLIASLYYFIFLIFFQTPQTIQQGTAWSGRGYFPSFPATSPYVTAVGATMGPESGNPEVACQSQLGGVITTGMCLVYL